MDGVAQEVEAGRRRFSMQRVGFEILDGLVIDEAADLNGTEWR